MKKIINIILFIVLLSSFTTAIDVDNLNDNAILYHDFETLDSGKLNDFVNNYDATIVTPVLDDFGIIDKSYKFNTTNLDHIYTPTINDDIKAINIWFNSSGIDGSIIVGGIIGTSQASTVTAWAGSYSGDITGETISIIQKSSVPREMTYIKDVISSGWTMLTLNWNATAGVYEIWINGKKKTQYQFNGGADDLLSNVPIYYSTGIGSYYWDDNLDESSIFNISLTSDDIEFLYQNGTPTSQQQYPFQEGDLTISLNYPENETHYQLEGSNATKVFNGTIVLTTNVNSNCTINNSDFSVNKTNGLKQVFNNNTVLSYGNYSIFVDCDSGSKTANTTFWFIIDTIPPNVTLNILNNSIQGTPFNLTIDYFDEYISLTNTTIYRESDGLILLQNFSGDLKYQTEWYNITFFVNLTNETYFAGDRIIMNLSVSDTHTDTTFEERPIKYKTKISDKKFNDYIMEHGMFRLSYPEDLDIEEDYSFDRMHFKIKSKELKEKKLKSKYTYHYVEADKIVYYPESDYPCHMIINNKYWYDCVGLKDPIVTKETDAKYRIDFFMDEPEVVTKSLGGLNELSTQYFFTINKNYTGNIYEGDFFNPSKTNFNYTSLYNFTVTSLNVNGSCISIVGASNSSYDGSYCYNLSDLKLEDVVLFAGATPVDCYITISNSSGDIINVHYDWFNKSQSVLESGNNFCDSGQIDCLLDELDGSLTGENDSILCQASLNSSWFDFRKNTSSLATSSVGECDAVNKYPIINVSYFDESDNSVLNASYSYDVNFFDGSSMFNIELNGTGTYTTICTDVDPSETVFNLNMYGNIILSSSGHITRVFNIPSTIGFLVSNDPYTNSSLYLIKIQNSSTISYTWQTFDYQQIDGTMLVYRCEDDGSRTLIESTTIASGDATSNLELYTTAYSYAVIKDDITYTDEEYYGCHVESVTEREYLVDISSAAFMPVIGLYLIDCEMTKVSDTVARMEWSSNPNDGSDIEGCIVGYRDVAGTRHEVYKDCVNQSSGSITRTVPGTSNNYYIVGELKQNNFTGYCQNTLVYANRDDFSQAAGPFGIFAAGILIVSLGLLFISSRTWALMGAGLGICVAWLIGVTSISGVVITGIVTILVVIIMIMRAVRTAR